MMSYPTQGNIKKLEMEIDEGPLVSIIVPVYNAEKYLARCLVSIVGQTYRNLEILLINDGSTDGSFEICHQYAERDARIRLFTQENQGQSTARNVGLDYMTGEYIAFVDSDDYISTRFVEILLRKLLQSNTLISRCKYVMVVAEEDNRELGVQIDDSIPCRIISRAEVFDLFGITENYVWLNLFHKSIFKSLRFPVGKKYEDMFLFPEIFWQIGKMCLIDTSLYAYRQSTDSTTRKGGMDSFCVDGIDARLKQLAFAQQHNLEKYAARIIKGIANEFSRIDYKEHKQYIKDIGNEIYQKTGKRLFSWRYLWHRAAPRSFQFVRKHYLKVKNWRLAHAGRAHM